MYWPDLEMSVFLGCLFESSGFSGDCWLLPAEGMHSFWGSANVQSDTAYCSATVVGGQRLDLAGLGPLEMAFRSCRFSEMFQPPRGL